MILAMAMLGFFAQELRPAGPAENLPDPPLQKLAPLAAKEIEDAKARAAGRALAGTNRVLAVNFWKKGKWQKRNNGAWLWRLRVQSPGASGLRIHFSRFDAPAASTVWLYEPVGKKGTDGPYGGKREEFWSGVVFGDSAVVEFSPPGGKKMSKLPFTIDRISHQF